MFPGALQLYICGLQRLNPKPLYFNNLIQFVVGGGANIVLRCICVYVIFFITVYRPVVSQEEDVYSEDDCAIPVSQNKRGLNYFSYQIKTSGILKIKVLLVCLFTNYIFLLMIRLFQI